MFPSDALRLARVPESSFPVVIVILAGKIVCGVRLAAETVIATLAEAVAFPSLIV